MTQKVCWNNIPPTTQSQNFTNAPSVKNHVPTRAIRWITLRAFISPPHLCTLASIVANNFTTRTLCPFIWQEGIRIGKPIGRTFDFLCAKHLWRMNKQLLMSFLVNLSLKFYVSSKLFRVTYIKEIKELFVWLIWEWNQDRYD